MTRVVAYSYDMDGCVFTKDHVYDTQAIIAEHEKLFAPAKSECYKKYVYCGSARQTHYHDQQNAEYFNGPLATTMVSDIARHLRAIHNTFLFADIATYQDEDDQFNPIYNIHSPGTHYKNKDPSSINAFSYQDTKKILLIYAQISNLCIHEPDADEIIFNFYDDREDILAALNFAFQICPILLPIKVTLKLWHYSDHDKVYEPRLFSTIQGCCEKQHNNYYDVIKNLIESKKLSPASNNDFLILKTDKIDLAYLNELVELGTNGAFSHHAGDGLIDHRNTYSQMPVFLSRDNSGQLDQNDSTLSVNECNKFWFF